MDFFDGVEIFNGIMGGVVILMAIFAGLKVMQNNKKSR